MAPVRLERTALVPEKLTLPRVRVGVEPTKYVKSHVKSGFGKIGIHKGDTGKIDSTKVNRTS